MYLWPCHTCPNKDRCEKEKTARRQLKNLLSSTITTATIRCKEIRDMYIRGLRVEASWALQEEDHEGTVIKWVGRKVLVWLDEPLGADGGRQLVNASPEFLRPLDEPLVRLCPICDKPEGQRNFDGWNCSACDTE